MLKLSGQINGRASIFVVPAEMPVTTDVMSVTGEPRNLTWGKVAMEMAADVDVNPAVPIGTEAMTIETRHDEDGALDFHFGDGAPMGNPYAFADKDAGWQAGVS